MFSTASMDVACVRGGTTAYSDVDCGYVFDNELLLEGTGEGIHTADLGRSLKRKQSAESRGADGVTTTSPSFISVNGSQSSQSE
jgi:hypothetical protein